MHVAVLDADATKEQMQNRLGVDVNAILLHIERRRWGGKNAPGRSVVAAQSEET
jgi:hypothetical protein